MSLAAQAKLLRILTDGQLLRVGSTKPRPVDVRVLVATHRDLQKRVQEGTFREDLYYRLAVVPIHLPPLRERREDIAGFCELFSRQVATDLKMSQRRLTSAAVENLRRYEFPGNVRELRNLIERAYILSREDEIGPEHFPVPAGFEVAVAVPINGDRPKPAPESHLPAIPFDLTEYLEKTERELILRTLATTHGAQAEAARRMGLSRSALAYKLNKYGIRVTPDWAS
jgi:DNA-binding NtrC family response regulator